MTGFKQKHRLAALCSAFALAALVGGGGCASGPSTNRNGVKEPTKEDRARLLVEAASGALGDNDPTGALQFLAQAEKLEPSNPEIYHTRALAFFVKQDLDQAIPAARKAVALKPDFSEANNTLGKLLLDQGKNKEAEPYLKAAATDSLYREAFKAYTNLGILHYRMGREREALASFDKAILENPNQSCVAHYYRGHLMLKEGRFPDAVRDYSSAIRKMCGNFQDAHLALGIAYERNKQYDQAKKKFLDIRQSFPGTKVADEAMNRLKALP